MKLEELDIDESELIEDGTGEEPFDEDTYQKDWMDPADDGDPAQDNIIDDEGEESEDIITLLLKEKGINPNSIKFQTEDGGVEEKQFGDLTREEQLQILNYNNEDNTYNLDDDEIALINELRQSGLDINEYKEYIANQAISNYIQNANEPLPEYQVDTIPDDELFVLDLKAKIPDLTEEDANTELELAKQNEALYNKKIESIRAEYKEREDAVAEQERIEAEQKLKDDMEQFEEIIVNTIQNNDTIDLGESSLTLSEDDMNEIASFILDSDAAGVRYLAKALNDPKTLVKMSWYALKGEEALSQISDYYKQKITEAAKFNYNKGYQDAKNGVQQNSNKTVVKKSTNKKTSNVISINDLD